MILINSTNAYLYSSSNCLMYFTSLILHFECYLGRNPVASDPTTSTAPIQPAATLKSKLRLTSSKASNYNKPINLSKPSTTTSRLQFATPSTTKPTPTWVPASKH
jgi:hypothetical protein